jgi:PAS domain S-box-containing protein
LSKENISKALKPNPKAAEIALRESEERLRTLVTNIPGAVYRCAGDTDWTMTFLSDGIEDICGHPASDFLSDTTRSYASVIHPDDQTTVQQIVLDALSRHETFNLTYRVLHADGTIRWVHEKGQGVFDEKGKLASLDGVIIDVTERKMVDSALKENQEKYKSIVENSTDAILLTCPDGKIVYANPAAKDVLLQRTHDDMQRAFELQRQFLNNVTHEVRTPLTAIQGYAQMILEGLAGPVPEEQAALLHKILSCSKSLLEMVSGVLDIARIKSGIFGGHYTFCNLREIAKKAIAAVTPQATEKGLSIHVDTATKDLSGLYDQEKILVILTNLLSNSIKFTDQGDICVLLHRDADVTEIIVADCGIGIAETDLDCIFDEFKQLDCPRKHKPSGFGIGLAIVASMVYSMRGSITVSSETGAGTAFTLRIPTPNIDQSNES